MSAILGWLTAGCAAAVGGDYDDGPVDTFERVWADYDLYYGMFDVKHVDWDALHDTFAAQVDGASSDRDLYDALTEMLAHLDDKHVTLYPATSPELPTWSVDLVDGVFVAPPFDRDAIVAHDLERHHVVDETIEVGRLPGGVGWIHILSFDGSPRGLGGAIDDALGWLGDVNGIVVDVRDNPGGFDPAAQAVAGRFADRERLYMIVQKRDGPAHDDLTAPVEWTVVPQGEQRFTGPVVLLTSYATQSAAETFSLAMRELPNVTHVGVTTSGAFSDAVLRDAPNGWAFTISVGDYRDARGRSHESLGLVPDVAVVNAYPDVRAGVDRTLDTAVELLGG